MTQFTCQVLVTNTYEGEVAADSVEDVQVILTRLTPCELEFDLIDSGWATESVKEVIPEVPTTRQEALALVDKMFPPASTNRKTVDASKFTQHQFTFIQEAHSSYVAQKKAGNLKGKTLEDVAAFLNEKLGLNKSKGAYGTIWGGKVKKELLPPGEPINLMEV